MTTNPALDRVSDQTPVGRHGSESHATSTLFDADGDPIDDFAGGAPSWPTLDMAAAEPEHGQQVGRATQTAADDVPAADSASAGTAAAPAQGDGPDGDANPPPW